MKRQWVINLRVFRSLYSKLALVLTGLFVLVGLAFIALTMFSTEMYQQEVNQKLNSRLAQHIVNDQLLMKDRSINEKALEGLFHNLMVINPSVEIYLLDLDGRILAYSAPPGKVKRKSIDLQPLKEWLDGSSNLPILGDDPRDFDGKKSFSVAPILEDGRLGGYLYVILGGETYDSIVQKMKGSFILKLSVWVILGSLLFALLAGLFLFAMLTGRLRRLADRMDGFWGEEKPERITTHMEQRPYSTDEIDRMESTFKEMAERIQSQMERLKKSDSLRRELITNVSHDLRTPLATLQGYIETLLLKKDSLTQEERQNYLEIAINHCKRLSRLVSELLELAKLDAEEISLRKEPFNLSELVQDVVQKFQLKADEKNIDITSRMEQGLPFVFADIGLIERVLENLIENALHYTPENGTIGLILKREDEDVLFQINDTGQGIPKDELPHIFNRFYQLDQSRKGEPEHSGLGLAITKRILALHERTINVESTLNSGTTFTFELPVNKTI